MSGLFPMFSFPQDHIGALPLYRDVQMDYEMGHPMWAGGTPVLVTGLEAVRGWAWRAVDTARYRFSVFSWSFGCELETLVGQPYRANTSGSAAISATLSSRRLEAASRSACRCSRHWVSAAVLSLMSFPKSAIVSVPSFFD